MDRASNKAENPASKTRLPMEERMAAIAFTVNDKAVSVEAEPLLTQYHYPEKKEADAVDHVDLPYPRATFSPAVGPIPQSALSLSATRCEGSPSTCLAAAHYYIAWGAIRRRKPSLLLELLLVGGDRTQLDQTLRALFTSDVPLIE